MFVLAFATRRAEADLKQSWTEKPSSNLQIADSESKNATEERDRQAGVVEHRTEASELEKLKRRIGVREESKDYAKRIDGHGTGLLPPTEKEWLEIADKAYIVENILSGQEIQPLSNVDHTAKPWFPPIGDQGSQSSCVAWAVGYYMKTFQEAKEHNWDLTGTRNETYPLPNYQDKIISPAFIYNLINRGRDAGTYYEVAIALVCNIGTCTWKEQPYNQSDFISWPSEAAWREAAYYRGNDTGYEYMLTETDENLQNLKDWIASDNLVVISVDAYQYGNLTDNDFWTLDNYVEPYTNHANTIVGYDDNIEYMEAGELRHGAFKIVNSWGIGEYEWEHVPDGCFWISYETLKQRVGYCMFCRDRIGYKPELLSSFRIEHLGRAACDIWISMGNHSDPLATKPFHYFVDGGFHPFPPNNIILDITEFKENASTIYNQIFFMKVYDDPSYHHVGTGNITQFSVQHAISEETPVQTMRYGDVFVDLFLPDTVNVPSHYQTIQEAVNSIALAVNPGPNVSIRVASGTYNENVVINKTLSLIGEDLKTTIIDGNALRNVIEVRSDNVTIAGFTIRNSSSDWPNQFGIILDNVSNCKIRWNNIADNNIGIGLINSSYNRIYHNNFEENNIQTHINSSCDNVWDNGYPSGGNYWIDYIGADLNNDGMGDIPYVIDTENEDNYPLIKKGPPPNIAVAGITPSKNIVGQGFTLNMTITAQNLGHKCETFNLTIYENTTIVTTFINVSVTSENPTAITYRWNTTSLAKGNYTIIAYAIPIPDEIDTTDNTCPSDTIYVGAPGDTDGDGQIDVKDVYAVAKAFGSSLEGPDPPNRTWNPLCDINNDGEIDIKDYYIVCKNYGKTDP